MMWKALVVALLVAAAAADQGWKTGSEYKYQVRGRTLTALHQVANQYTGVVLRAQLTVQPKSDNLLTAKVSNAEYAKVHQEMPAGWGTPIPDSKLSFRSLPVASKPFQIKLKNGIVDELIVSKSVPTWEVNILKSIVSQLQVDTKAENLISSRINNKPSHGSVNGVYKTMEDDVTGECEVVYDISPLPQYQLQSRPELAPMPQLRGDGQLIDIVKTKNFSHCEQRPGYHFGLNGQTDVEPASAKMGEFLARSSVSRVVVSGSLQRYTIQSSVTTNKILVSPVLYNNQKGMVVSRMNLTLTAVTSSNGHMEAPSNPRKIKDLVYDYNDPFSTTKNADLDDETHRAHKRNAYDSSSSGSDSSSTSSCDESNSRDDSSSGSSSSCESSEENSRMNSNAAKRFRRSLKKNNNNSDESNSDDSNSDERQMNGKGRRASRKNDSDSSSSSSSRSSSRSDSDSDSSSSSSDSTSSSEEWFQEKPKMTQAPKDPLLPYFVGYMGSSIQASGQINAVHAVEKLAKEIAHELQQPNQIPEKATLAKFSILARLIRTMDAKQLEQAARELYYAPSSHAASQSQSATEKAVAWKAFRDAVAQAGTGPAFLLIKDLIQTHKIQGEEAAEIIAALPTAARTPTKQYMDAFFELIKKSEVQKQQFLNVSAVLSFTNLVRKAQVDNATAHNRYPTHVYGRLNPKKASAVARDYIPYLAQQLKDAVQSEDSHKIQVYIRALGNTAHPKILSVFEPYLEGKKAVSHFQRLHMVVALNKLAKVSPKIARPVLFRLYQNTGEAHEIRCIAVYMLMKTNPPASMLQRMAEFTNQDPSNEVRSAVKSAIESAANKLNAYEQQELSQNANAAVDMLNATKWGAQFSKVQLWSEDVEADMSLAYQAALATIGSEDSNIPQLAFVNNGINLGGYRYKYFSAGAMASSVDDLLSLFLNQWQSSQKSGKHHQGKRSSNSNSEWSVEKIANMLNIQPEEAAQIEANVLVNLLGQQRFFAIDNHTVEQLPHFIQKAANTLRTAESFNYTKLYNKISVTMGFPTAMGLPFVYNLKNPSLLSVGGEARLRTQPDLANGPKDAIRMPEAVNASADIQFVYSTKLQAKIGFITPFDHMGYVAGLDKDMQINLPIRANMDLDLVNAEMRVKLQPIEAKKKAQIAMLASRPYTAQKNILDLSPEDQKPIQVRQPHQVNFTVGQDMTGMAFRIDAATEAPFADFAEMYNQFHKQRDIASIMLLPTAEETIKAYEFAVSYEPQRSTAHSVTLTASYDNNKDENDNNNDNESQHYKKSKRSNKQQSDESNSIDDDSNESMADFGSEKTNANQNAANPSNNAPNSQNRQQQFLRRAAAGIKSAEAAVIDLSAQFNGETKAQFVATAAIANSPVDEKSRMLVYLRRDPARAKKQELALTATSKMPNVPVVNYKKAISAEPTSAFRAQIHFGEKLDSSAAQITIDGQMKQTSERREFVRRQPLTQLCEQQMERGNHYLPACRNATLEANRLDQYKASVHFEKVGDWIKNATYKAYAAARYLGWQYSSENFVNPKNAHSNKVDLELRFAPNMKSANLSMDAPALRAEFNNVRLNKFVAAAAAMHPMYTPWEMLAQKAMKHQYNPTCVVDKNAVNTFDNRTYPLNMGNNWHVMMVSVPKEDDDRSSSSMEDATDRVSVLVRDAGSQDKKEVKIMLGDDLVEMTASGSNNAEVKVNGRTVRVSSRDVTEVQGQDGELLIQLFALPDAVKMVAPEHQIEILFDGARVVLHASARGYSGEVRGLCGTFTSEAVTDFTTPANCILREPKNFAATWALNPSGAVREQQQKAQQAQCYRKVVMIGDAVSDAEAGRYQAKPRSNSDKHSSGKRASGKGSKHGDERSHRFQTPGECSIHRTKAIEHHGEICFSVKPQPACKASCQPDQQFEKEVQFHCIADSSAARHLQEQIKNGASPDFSKKSANKSIKVTLPESCRP